MPKLKDIANHLKHLMMTVTLLWALMLNGQEVVAYTSTACNEPVQTDTKLADAPHHDTKTVVKQKVSLEATTSFVALNLQQAVEPFQMPLFAKPTNEITTGYSTYPHGVGALAKLFPITIQPNAP
jgi:hypothetical protein